MADSTDALYTHGTFLNATQITTQQIWWPEKEQAGTVAHFSLKDPLLALAAAATIPQEPTASSLQLRDPLSSSNEKNTRISINI